MKKRTIALCVVASILTSAIAAQGQVPGVNSTLQAMFNLVYDNSTMKPTFSATIQGFAPASSATDICLLNGSATKTIKVRRIFIGILADNAISEPIAIIKRSTANTGGTSGSMSRLGYDSTNSLTNSTTNTPTALALYYVANPTPGTAVGTIADPYIQFGNYTTTPPTTPNSSKFEFGQLGSPIVLRGVAQGLAVNLGGITVTTGKISCTFEWTEE